MRQSVHETDISCIVSSKSQRNFDEIKIVEIRRNFHLRFPEVCGTIKEKIDDNFSFVSCTIPFRNLSYLYSRRAVRK